jgi:ABC-type nitrate/sulfonate/bicarbonate transport system permease component
VNSSNRTSAVLPLLVFWGVIVGITASIELLVRTRVLSPAVYAAPSEMVLRLIQFAGQKDFWAAAGWTTARTFLSVAIGFPLGVALTLVIYESGPMRRPSLRIVDFFRSIPLTALLPIYIGIAGIGETTELLAGASAAIMVTVVTVWAGIENGQKRARVLLHFYAPSEKKSLCWIVLPQSIPFLIAAIKLSVSSALVLVVVVEMFVGGDNSGLGRLIANKTYGDDRAGEFAAVVVTGILGYALNSAFDYFQKRPGWSIE